MKLKSTYIENRIKRNCLKENERLKYKVMFKYVDKNCQNLFLSINPRWCHC